MSITRFTHATDNSVAIIGAGLVGGAVLVELVLNWAQQCLQKETIDLPRKPETAAGLKVDRIHITATSESKLQHQLGKTRNFLSRAHDVEFENEGPLHLTIRIAKECLQIHAEPLDLIPKGLTLANLEDETFMENSSLHTYLLSKRPRVIVIAANLASIVAYRTKELQNQTLAWILTALKRATDKIGIEAIAIVGTTALGGQGTNLVWTHQSAQALDSKLIGKILAAYGILGVFDRMRWDTDSTARLILLTPGSVLGFDYLGFGAIKYFALPEGLPDEVADATARSDMSIPLYEPLEVDLSLLSDQAIDWNERRMANALLTGASVKCGENGELSPLQFACITHAFQMGFNSNAYIAKILIDELAGRPTGYNQIPLGAGKVIEPSAQGQTDRLLILKRLSELEQENHARSAPVYPAVGSARAQKEIVSADLLFRLLRDTQGEPTLQRLGGYDPEALAMELWNYLLAHPSLFAEITAVIPVISPAGHVCTGPYSMYLGKGIKRSSDLAELIDENYFRAFAALGAVDLRPVCECFRDHSRTYVTGVGVLVKRARFILEHYVDTFPPELVDSYGSSVDLRIRHWLTLTSNGQTAFDPVFFVVQFLGGERPYQ